MAVDSFSHSSSEALNDLDPLSRALLDLSVQRGMDDSEIAGVLGTDENSVFEVRVGLLRALAEKVAPEHVDDDVPDLQAVIAERLYAEDGANGTSGNGAHAAIPVDDVPEIDEAEGDEPEGPALEAVPDWAKGPAEPKASPDASRKRRSPLTFLVPILGVVALVAVVVAITSGGADEGSSPSQAPATGGGDQPADTKGSAARFEAIGAGDARGTARLSGDRLTLKLRGLADPNGGSYEVWLYDSIIDAKSLGASQGTKIDLDAKLPANARDFEYVDVSLEPADGNPNHSGQSVLRIPVDKLPR